MSRKAVPARVKTKYQNGFVLYEWRPRPGAKAITGKGLGGEAQLQLFKAHVLLCWDAEVEPTSPGTFLTRKGPTAAPEVAAPKSTAPTLRQWIGDPPNGDLGEFFAHAEHMGSQNKKLYESMFRNHGAFDLIGDVPMDQVTADHVIAILDQVLRCPSCADRAALLSPAGVIPASALRADNPPFDGVDCKRHYPSRLLQRTSVRAYCSQLKAAFNAAMRAKVVTENPFAHVRYGTWDEPETNNDSKVSLTHLQLDVVMRNHPKELKVIPSLSTAGMFRREEMWGLQRIDFPMPPEDPIEDPDQLTFQLSRVWHVEQKRFVKKGKTDASLGTSISIGASEIKVLNNHLRNYMPSTSKCDACVRGERIWRGDRKRNPHAACGFANDAPLIPLDLCTPQDYSGKVCPQVQLAAGLSNIGFDITHNVYRTTGASQYLAAGVPEATVVKMGRWTNSKTLQEHYNRPNENQFDGAIQLRDQQRAAELGLDVSDPAPILGQLRFKDQKISALSAECDRLKRELAKCGLLGNEIERPEIDESVRLPNPERLVGKWARLSDNELCDTIASASSQLGILVSLGLSTANKNYVRLRAEAKRLDVELPERWASLRTGAPV